MLILPIALLGWLTVAAAAMLPGTINTAIIPAGQKALPLNVAIIDQKGPLWVVYSDDPGYVIDLYKAGVAFVLPGRNKTCLNWPLQ